MNHLSSLFTEHEDWLMQRTLSYAKEQGYTKYTSTLQEAWRLSISGLTASLCEGMKTFEKAPELGPDDDFSSDSLSEFGRIEAQRHRKRGVTLAMFLGLMKYYRQSYLDLLVEKPLSLPVAESDRLFINRCFDRIEVAFCHEWANIAKGSETEELQIANRFMTNEKNAYLTAFESLSDPVLMLDREEKIINLNNAASLLIDPSHVPGGHYYHAGTATPGDVAYGKHAVDTLCIGKPVDEIFPWLKSTLATLKTVHGVSCECEAVVDEKKIYFDVRRSDMLDVSEKFTSSIIVLRIITLRKLAEMELKTTVARLESALADVKKLTGLLPICASCKKVRDDKGYWSQVEEYVADHSEATFSHGICPECVTKLYPEFATAILARHERRAEALRAGSVDPSS